MPKIYYGKDAKLSDLKGKTVGIIGYGAQGRAQSLNLRDSGVKVIVGQRKGGANYKRAIKEKWKPVSAEEVAKKADIINILVQDHLQEKLYKTEIKQHLKKGKALVFSHGFNIHYGQIKPPKNVDVFMVAPKAPGSEVRIQYEEGMGVPSLVAIHQNASGKALKYALAYAKGIGSGKAGVIRTTFKDETETDLFGEQAVLCGGTSELIKAGFDTLVNAGYPKELAYFECLHELKLIVDIIYNKGLPQMRHDISDTAEYGDYSRGKRIVTSKTRQEMKKILKEIQSGKFAREWINENKRGRPRYNKWKKDNDKAKIEKVGKKLRSMMSWVKA